MKTSLALAASAFALVASAASAQSGGVPVYDATQLAHDRYTIVARLGIEDWASSFRIRGHRDLESAKLALVNDAARRGADGVINLTCFDKTDGLIRSDGYYCYGNAIRIKNERALP